jgi:hypothetical protein
MRRLAAAALGVMLAACGPGGGGGRSTPEGAARDMVAMEAAISSAEQPAEAVPGASPEKRAAPVEGRGAAGAAPLLAYEYAAGIEAPVAAVEPLMKLHQARCATAGLALCQVIGASSQAYGDDRMSAQLTIRAEPRWLAQFREGLEGEAAGAGGRLVSESVTSEDLTRAIVDTEARLSAQKTLRARLQEILRTRPGKLADLLETERELANVQANIDSAESTLVVMRAQVAMSLMRLDYATRPNPVAASALAPIGEAANNFIYLMAQGVAAIITIAAVALPWLIVGLPAAWLVRRWWRGRRARKAVGAPPG